MTDKTHLIYVAAIATIGPPPDVQTLFTLGAAAALALLACASRTVQANKGIIPPLGVFLSELGIGLVAGIMLPLWISDIKPIGFGTAVVLGGLGGAFGFAVIKGIANAFGLKWGVRIEADKPDDSDTGESDDDKQPNGATAAAER